MGQAILFNSSDLAKGTIDPVDQIFRYCLSLLENTGRNESDFAVAV